MLEFRNVKVYDLPESIVSSGYAMTLDWNEYGTHLRSMNAIYGNNLLQKLYDYATPNECAEKTWSKDLSELDVKLKDGTNYRVTTGNGDSDKLIYTVGGDSFETTIENALRFGHAITDIGELYKLWDLSEECSSSLGVTCDEFKKLVADARRTVRLKNASDMTDVHCHDNWLTGVRVSFDMKYTQYITKQFQRYHWFDYVSSSSLMHRITKMDFSKCCNKYVTEASVKQITEFVDKYNSYAENRTETETFTLRDGTVIEAKTHKEVMYTMFMIIVSNCPMGTELFVHVSTNYKQLQTIYRQRRNHKLKEDWESFKRMVEDLDLSQYVII